MIQAIEQNHIFALNRDCIASCIEISFLFAMQILNLVISIQSNLFIWLGNSVLCRSFQMVYLIATISIRTSYIHIWAHFALFFLQSQYLTLFNSDIALHTCNAKLIKLLTFSLVWNQINTNKNLFWFSFHVGIWNEDLAGNIEMWNGKKSKLIYIGQLIIFEFQAHDNAF